MSWTAINRGCQPLPSSIDLTDGAEPVALNPLASKHRDAILKAVTNLATYWNKPNAKRKQSFKSDVDNKRSNLESTTCLRRSSAMSQRRLRPRRQTCIGQQKEQFQADELGMNRDDSSAEVLNLSPGQDMCQTPSSTLSEPETISLEEAGDLEPAVSDTNDIAIPKQENTDDLFADLDDSYFDNLGQYGEDDLLPTLSQSSVDSDNSSLGPLTPVSSDPSGNSPPKWPIPPFLRAVHPETLASIEHSPIPSLTSTAKIQTCFRIAEAVRLLNVSRSTGCPVTIELFAIATEVLNNRNPPEFRFADIFFPDRPPYINGRHAHTAQCHQVGTAIHVIDTPNSTKQIARAILKSPSPSPSSQTVVTRSTAESGVLASCSAPTNVYSVTVEHIRESCWDEIKHVRGIVDSEGVERERRSRGG